MVCEGALKRPVVAHFSSQFKGYRGHEPAFILTQRCGGVLSVNTDSKLITHFMNILETAGRVFIPRSVRGFLVRGVVVVGLIFAGRGGIANIANPMTFASPPPGVPTDTSPSNIQTGECDCNRLDRNGYPFPAMTTETTGPDGKVVLVPCEEIAPRVYKPVSPGSRTPPAPCP